MFNSLDLRFSALFSVSCRQAQYLNSYFLKKEAVSRKTFMPNRHSGNTASSSTDYLRDNSAFCEVIDCVDDYCKDAIDLTAINRSILLKVCLH